MKILLDNCIPRPFERHLSGHEVVHCSRLGWERLVNGALLSAAEEEGFSVLITVDQGIQHQQNLSGRKIAVVSLKAGRNDMLTLTPLSAAVLDKLDELQPGTVITIQQRR